MLATALCQSTVLSYQRKLCEKDNSLSYILLQEDVRSIICYVAL